jgi:hypothetical protein
MILTPGDKNVVHNLRGQHPQGLANYSDEVIALAWRIFSQSDEHTGHPSEELFVEWCKIAEEELK